MIDQTKVRFRDKITSLTNSAIYLPKNTWTITLPTPKQEQLADNLSKYNKRA